MKCYFSDKYYEGLTHLSADGKKEYYLDSIIKPLWVYELSKKHEGISFVSPNEFREEDSAFLGHSKEYISSLKSGHPRDLSESSGLRWVPNLYNASLSSVDGYISSAITALKEGVACSLSTNFHHAQKSRGSGFCVLNGMAICALYLHKFMKINRILVLDCDYHYGDGTASILKDLPFVKIIDIYGGKHTTAGDFIEASNLETFHVSNATDYFNSLEFTAKTIASYKPEIVLYDAGADIWEEDRYGGIKGMSIKKIKERDSLIFNECSTNNIPISFMIGGGYVKYNDKDKIEISEAQKRLAQIHLNTLMEASSFFDLYIR